MADLIVTFAGLDANQNHIEAFSGVESMAGIARALTLIAHYSATGEVRHRFPFSTDIRFYLEDTEPGSFKWRLRLMIAAGFTSPLITNIGSSAIYDIGKTVITRCIGGEPDSVSSAIKDLDRSHGGDMNALVEAIEPALKKGHYGIGQTTRTITITEEHKTSIIVKFDNNSKAYLTQDIPGNDDSQQVSISALNANDRTGRAYFLDLKRTIPFRVSKNAKANTLAVLSASLDAYVNKDPAPVEIAFERVEAADGRLKRIIIFGAKNVAGTN